MDTGKMKQETATQATSQRPHRLVTLGQIDLIGPDGSSVDTVLHQPKRLALLVYLAVSNHGALCRRDNVLGVFWPEFDQERARAALRKALHFLRHQLTADAIISRGSEEIGVDPDRLSCDVRDFETAHRRGDLEATLSAYTGDFLESFFVTWTPTFEEWVEVHRRTHRDVAQRAARTIFEQAAAESDWTRAEGYASLAVTLEPYDDAAVQQLIVSLANTGQRTRAIEEYQAFVARLAQLSAEPSHDTENLIQQVRHGPAWGQAPTVSPKLDEASAVSVTASRWRVGHTSIAAVVAFCASVLLVAGCVWWRSLNGGAGPRPAAA